MALTVLGAVAACGPPAPAEQPGPRGGGGQESARRPAASADELVLSGLVPLGDTRVEMRAALGEPSDSSREVVPNRHVPGVMDTLIVLEYPGLAIHIHRPGGEGAGDLVSRVDVRDARWLRFSRPTIGSTIEELEGLLGPPAEVDGDGFTYSCSSCEMAETSVQFLIGENRVREVRFFYYVD
jgi:hypothetical protein